MITAAKVRFGMVGAGAIAQAYAQAFGQCENAELVAVADVREDAANAVASLCGCEAFTDYAQMAERCRLDAVVVCTPPSTHPEICIAFANRGVHVLCEKPLAIDSQSAEEMLAAAISNGVKLTMASKFRHVDDVIRTKAILTSGILGDIVLFENSFTGYVDMSTRWNSNPSISGGGVLIDNGTHSVDIMRYLLGPIAELQVIEGRRIQQLEVEDTVRVFVRSTEGVMGSIDLSWSINKVQESYINLYGSLGTVIVGWKGSKYRRCSDDDWIEFGSGYNKFSAFQNQIDNFARGIQGTEALRITSEDALASVKVIESAYEALNSSTWQPVDLVESPSRTTAETVS